MSEPNKPGKDAWARPVAQQKDSHLRTWLVFIGLILIGFALWVPVRALWTRQIYVQTTQHLRRDATAFEVLAYPGVSEEAFLPDSRDVTPQQFAEQVDELARRGYHAISLDDVVQFYQHGKLLPSKSILITFEQTRKSSYFEVRDVLKKHKWKAVMGVWTDPIHKKDAQALLWPYLEDMATFGMWDLASESKDGFNYIPAGPEGQTAPFFAVPKWLSELQRYEVPEEFTQRIAADHQAVLNEFKDELGITPVAFFYPYGDYGQYDAQAQVVRAVNLREAGKVYPLGFTLGTLPLNTRETDPLRLRRLLIDKTLSAQDLADHLDLFWPVERDKTNQLISDYGAKSWITEWGDVSAQPSGELRVAAVPPSNPVHIAQSRTATTGAKAWLAGSDLFQDGYVSMRFQLRRGRFALYLRSTSRGEYVCFSLDPLGNVTLRQKLQIGDEYFLATDSTLSENRSDYELLVGLRGNLAYVRLNDKLLFNGPVRLYGSKKQGMIGVGVWDEVIGIGDVLISGTKLISPEDAVVTWAPEVVRDPAYLSQWLHENSYRFTIISPPWMDIQAASTFMLPKWDTELIQLLAKINNCKIVPQMNILDANYLTRVSSEGIVADLGLYNADGLYVDANQCPVDQLVPLTDWLIRLNALLNPPPPEDPPAPTAVDTNATQRVQVDKPVPRLLLLRLPPNADKMPSVGNLVSKLDNVVIVGDYKAPPFDLDWSRVYRVFSVEPEDGMGPLSLYYQITTLKEGEDQSPEAQGESLRQQGFEAFTLGDYKKAISLWQDWARIAPQRSEPYALMGDAYIRLNELDSALEAFTTSLDMNPGQMDLAVRKSRLLDRMGKSEEQAAMLDLYARTFPGTSSIIIEQAKWLAGHRNQGEACKMMQELVEAHPEEIEARTVLQGMLTDPQARYDNLKGLRELIAGGETSIYGIGKIFANSDLLALREASVFFSLIRQVATTAFSHKVRQLFAEFLPLQRPICEEFVEGRPSDDWMLFGNIVKSKGSSSGKFELRASSEMSEAYLRLRRSDLMREGIMQVELDESVGFFWLYIRRSSGAMIRFGFDDDGFIRVQAWVGSDIAGSESRVWLRPPGTLKIRLTVRGDGVYGAINGKPVFTTPLLIPNELRYGWWGVAPFSSELGFARAKINRISVIPTPPTILMVPEMLEDEMVEFLDKIRPSATQISALAPIEYRQQQDGTIEENTDFKRQTLKMFASFHRMRYMPVIDCSYYYEPDIDRLMQIIKERNLTSFALCVREMPSQRWLDMVQTRLESTPSNLLIITCPVTFWATALPGQTVGKWLEESPDCKLKVRQIERGNVLIAPVADLWSDLQLQTLPEQISPVVDIEDVETLEVLTRAAEVPSLNVPRFYIYPARGIPKKTFKMEPVAETLQSEPIRPMNPED